MGYHAVAEGVTTPSRKDSASDGEMHVPSISQLTRQGGDFDDDPAMATVILTVPFQQRLCSICQQSGRGNIMVLRLQEEIRHMREDHAEKEIEYRCDTCLKIFKSSHAALCHVPKCPGPSQPIEGPRCEECGQTYRSVRALSQHQRHIHPVLRNEIRKAQSRDRGAVPKPVNRPNAWTDDELRKLAELKIRFQHEKFVAKAISEVLVTKTNK